MDYHQSSEDNPRFVSTCVTGITGVIVALTFLFGFGNGWALCSRVGLTGWFAPLIAPSVDLSVVGLLIAMRYLVKNRAPIEQLRRPRRWLRVCTALTFLLQVGAPAMEHRLAATLIAAIPPTLLMAWAEMGPDLLTNMWQTITPPEPDERPEMPVVAPTLRVVEPETSTPELPAPIRALREKGTTELRRVLVDWAVSYEGSYSIVAAQKVVAEAGIPVKYDRIGQVAREVWDACYEHGVVAHPRPAA